MPRITSAAPDLRIPVAQNEPDFDTANRLRENQARPSMHEGRDTDADIRNLPRTDSSEYTWRRPMNLDAPSPRPGMVQRWVRVEFRSENDNLNWQSKAREGWRPRDPASIPSSESYFGYTSSQHNGQGVIRVGGLILMETEERRLLAKRQAIRMQIQHQENSVSTETDKVSREGQALGAAPIVREERTEVSTGRRPTTMAN